eukprot:5906229-Amphidinium_carterae.1
MEAVRIIIIVASLHHYPIIPGDFSVAFMHTPMDEEVFIEPPRELVPDTSQIWLLQKALNGLRTASQNFQRYLYKILTQELGFQASRACPALLWHERDDVRIAVHVDDPCVCYPPQKINGLYANLQKWLEVRQGEEIQGHAITRYLGRNYVKWQNGYMEMPVEGYIDRIVELACASGLKRVSSPGIKRAPPTDGCSDSRLLDPTEHSVYRQVVGMMQYIIPRRPDIMYALKRCGRQLAQPRVFNMQNLQRIAKYLESTKDMYLKLEARDEAKHELDIYSDTDWAGCQESRRSTSCCLVTWCGCLVHCQSKTQVVRALSSLEAEFYGMCSAAAAEGLYVKQLLLDVGFDVKLRLHTDASSALAISERQGVGRLRHVQAKYLWLQDQVMEGRITVCKIAGVMNPADIGTKYLAQRELYKCGKAIGLFLPGHESDEGESTGDGSSNHLTEAVVGLLAGAMQVPRQSRHNALRLLMGALLWRRSNALVVTVSTSYSGGSEGHSILFTFDFGFGVLVCAIVSLVFGGWWLMAGSGSSTELESDFEVINGHFVYLTEFGKRVHINGKCTSLQNSREIQKRRFCQLCSKGVQASKKMS